MTKIACMSDIHNRQSKIVCPEADILVVAGDLTNRGSLDEIKAFGEWLSKTPYKYKVIVAGNHDWGFERDRRSTTEMLGDGHNGVHYLEDSGIEIMGLKFWGSPWQPEFCGWAFNVDFDTKKALASSSRSEEDMERTLEDYWDMIPNDTNVLITHGPPYNMRDLCPNGQKVGSRSLFEKVIAVKPDLHVFGHIHHSAGVSLFDGITFVNAAVCDERYDPVNPIVVVEL